MVLSEQHEMIRDALRAFAHKEQWLKPLARGEMLGAFCLTISRKS